MTQPFVSIIVPVRNEERYIERCLFSIALQDYPRSRFEIIVVDGESSDMTREIVNRFAAECDIDLHLFANLQRKTAAGLNVGLRQARGEVIVRIDGHACMAPDFLRRSVGALAESDADCVGGVIESEGEGVVGGAIALAMSSPFGVGGAAFRTGGAGEVDTVAFGAYRRDVFDRVGEFAEDIDRGEDDEFNYRLRDDGGRILLVPGIRSSYTVRSGLGALARQYFAYGRAKPEVLRRHPAQMQLRQLAPAAFVVSIGSALLLALCGTPRALKAAGGAYSLAAAIASLALARRGGWRFLVPLPVAFACLHVGYGLGFLAGLLGLAGRICVRPARSVAREDTEAPN
ncbi:MAG: glycosyltransferase family 2 protein [Chloroflexota bacterium]|nr:glycosyltransferase family 2 protein [Chloroflexota bacterium]